MERNIIIATTDMEGVSKLALDAPQRREHYSDTTSRQSVWGTEMVYSDKMVRLKNTVFSLKIELS